MSPFVAIEKELAQHIFKIASYDLSRPWGGFFVIKEEDAQRFSDIYFDGFDVESLRIAGKLSPKILLVKPLARLSWQYHDRRAETWRIVKGPVGVVRSLNDIEKYFRVRKNKLKILSCSDYYNLAICQVSAKSVEN